jgi:AcrR family transcriptional regulator
MPQTVRYGHHLTLAAADLLSTTKPYSTVRKMQTVAKARKDQRREMILAVASEVFFDEGYAAASMSTIAARLGGSKATLYNYFPSKEALFAAHVRTQCGRFAEDVLDFPDDEPVERVLSRLGERFLDHVLSDWAVRTFQIIVAEARRTPELARLFYEVGPAVGLERLQRYLEAAKARGLIDPPDCALAAGQFLSLCRGNRHLTCVLNLEPPPSHAVIATEVASAVAMFMDRYRAAAT